MGTRLGELIERFGGQLQGRADIEVAAIAPLDRAGPSDISFLSNSKLRPLAAKSHAAALILSPADEPEVAATYEGARVVTANPYAWFARAAQHFAQYVEAARWPAPEPGIHPAAAVHGTARIDPGART